MEEIIKVMLMEGIDESTIHRVLDVIEEEYEITEAKYDLSNPDIAYHKSVRRNAQKEVKHAIPQEKKLEKEVEKKAYRKRITGGDRATLADLQQYHLNTKPGTEEHQNVIRNYTDAIKKDEAATKDLQQAQSNLNNKRWETTKKMIRKDEAQSKVRELK